MDPGMKGRNFGLAPAVFVRHLILAVLPDAVINAIGDTGLEIIYHRWVKKLNKYNQVQKRLLALSHYRLYTLKSHHSRFTVGVNTVSRSTLSETKSLGIGATI
jgi:hypothetical protein